MRKKKTERQKLIKKCDELFSKIVRSKGACERCGKTTTLQTAHIVGRKVLGLRWNFDNAVCLCYRCHFYWCHRNPVEFIKWVCEKKGQKTYEMLRDFKPQPMKLDRIKQIYIYLNKLESK